MEDENTIMKLFVGRQISRDNHLYYMCDIYSNVDSNLANSLADTILYFEPTYLDYGIYG